MIGRIAFSLTHLLRRSNSLRLFQEGQKEPWQPPDEVRTRQFSRLSRLLAHAEGTVPYYRALFRSMGISAADIRSLDDFARLPALTKDVLHEHREALVSTACDRAALLEHHSGGSTGVPVAFYRDRSYIDASDAGTYRNMAQCGWRPGDMVAFFWGFDRRLNWMRPWEFELRQWLRRSYQFDPFKSEPDEMAAWLRACRRIRPVAALGYASTIARFAEFVEQSGERSPSLRGVFTTAEKLYAPQRATIERAFGCKVYDLYGSSEVQNIAAECPEGSMHVNADYCVVEMDHDAVQSDGPRPLLVTSLRQYAMPFLRYRNEDCGVLLDGQCACGRGFPLMRLDIARLSDNFVLPDGRVVHGEYFTHLMYGSEGIASFQFHQTAHDRIVLRIVPGVGSGTRRDQAVRSCVEQIRILSHGTVTVDVQEVDSIPLSAAGKHRFTRSDVSAPAAARPRATASVRAGLADVAPAAEPDPDGITPLRVPREGYGRVSGDAVPGGP